MGSVAGIEVRRLDPSEALAAARLHREVLSMEFLSQGGEAFLARYYRAWCRTEAGRALAAVTEDGALLGVLLGSVDPRQHVEQMLRRDGVVLGLLLVAHGLSHPSFGRALVATRASRYLRGVLRVLSRRLAARVATPSSAPHEASVHGRRAVEGLAEVTHLCVAPAAQGRGVGRALLAAFEDEARHAGAEVVELVTPPDLAARRFYEHLGFEAVGALRSRSGEPFVRYRHRLAS
jgi:ribosomal protein S18 acetylase RimI-like enzyme